MPDGFDYAEQQAAKSTFNNGDMVPTGNDAAYDAVFYMGKVPNFEGTDYSEVPHLRLKLGGDNNRVYDQPAIMYSTPHRPSDPERFPAQWAAFQRGEAMGLSGTLMADWDNAEPGDVRRLEMQGIKTVEQLAHVGDHQLANLGPGSRVLREAARAHLSGAADADNAALQDQVAKLTAITEGLMSILTPKQLATLQGGQAAPPA